MPICPEPGCGREMIESVAVGKDGEGFRLLNEHSGNFRCPATPDQHELAALRLERDTLKRELEEARKAWHKERAERLEVAKEMCNELADAQARVKELEAGMIQHLKNIQRNIEAAHYGDAHSYIDDLLSLLGGER